MMTMTMMIKQHSYLQYLSGSSTRKTWSPFGSEMSPMLHWHTVSVTFSPLLKESCPIGSVTSPPHSRKSNVVYNSFIFLFVMDNCFILLLLRASVKSMFYSTLSKAELNYWREPIVITGQNISDVIHWQVLLTGTNT